MNLRLFGLLFLVALIGLSGAREASSLADAQAGPPVPMVQLSGNVLPLLAQATPSTSPQASAVAASQPLTITVVLNRSDEAGFESYLRSVETPGSSGFDTPQQLAQQFGPSQQAYDAVLSYLEGQGFTLAQGSANRLTITVTGTAKQAEKAFNVSINNYQINGSSFFANSAEPSVPSALGPNIAAIVGLNNLARPQPASATGLGAAIADVGPATPGAPNPPTPASLAIAYDILTTTSVGLGQKLGLVEFDNYNPSDITAWLSVAALPSNLAGHVTQKSVNGGTPPSGTDGQAEATADVDMVLGIALTAQIVVYDAPNGPTSWQQMLNAMISDGDTVISNSWFDCEADHSPADLDSINSVMMQGAAQGTSIFTASGDLGDSCEGVPGAIGVPADSPNGIAVGGTSLQVNPPNIYKSESYWNSGCPTFGQPGESGGFGTSSHFAAPAWQGIAGNRSIPDVSANANGCSSIRICFSPAGPCPGSGYVLFNGTSMATPLWAAGAAVLGASLGRPLGNLAPALYGLRNTNAFHSPSSMSPASDFTHVGLGSFDLRRLYNGLGGRAP